MAEETAAEVTQEKEQKDVAANSDAPATPDVATNASAAVGAGDGKGKVTAPWYGEVDDDLKKIAERFASPADALRYAREARARESRAYLPGKNATEEEWAKYHKAVGIPEAPDKYEFPKLPADQLTDEVKQSREQWAKIFHENKLSTAQGKALAEAFNAMEKAHLEELKKQDEKFVKEAKAALEKEWGGKQQYEKQLTYADRAINELTNRAGVQLAELRGLEDKSGRFVLDNPMMAKLFAAVGREMAEGTLGGVVTSEERDTVEEQISDLRKKVEKAQEEGNSALANKLYQQQLALRAKLTNNQAIVGTQGRVA